MYVPAAWPLSPLCDDPSTKSTEKRLPLYRGKQMSHRKKRKKFRKPSGTSIMYSMMILLFVYLSVFRLPWFFPERITSSSGFISNISVEEGSALNTRRSILSFEMNHSAYYFTLTGVIEWEDCNSLVSSLQTCEVDHIPITIEITSEKDYRDWPLSQGREHAVSISYGAQSIPADAYRNDVAFLRIVLLAFALILTIPMLFLWRLDRGQKHRKEIAE